MESNTTGSNSFSWTDVNWKALERLRARFLSFDQQQRDPHDAGPGSQGSRGETPSGSGGASSGSRKALAAPDHGDYWNSHSELASYDFTFGERIGWKWDTVIAELKERGWTPPEGTALDWGCGTGVAGRRIAKAWPRQIKTLRVSDRSLPAQRFSALQAAAAGIAVQERPGDAAPNLLVISHVLNELLPAAFEKLLALAERAEAVLWIEPGTHPVSHQLIAARERLKAHFRVIAPCPHQEACGLLAPGNEPHWCHHFAKVPGFVHTDPGWGRFAQTLKLDLSTLPMSFLVLDRRPGLPVKEGNARILGEPRYYKGFSKILTCQADGVRELTLQKRDAPELLKAMKKDPGSLYQWECDGDKIRNGERVF